ncbi:hypothetical protein CR513_12989, partial [Mucuna pruriens]
MFLMFGVLIFWASNGYSYILLVVDYVSRWVEAIATKSNDAKVVVGFLKSNIFYRFMTKGVTFATKLCPPYSTSMGWCIELPQHTTPRQMAKLKYSIGKSRNTLQMMVNRSRKDWSRLLEDALWAHKTAY